MSDFGIIDKRDLVKMTGIPASVGVCEPIEGFAERPDLIHGCMKEMADKLTAARDEAERLRARVAELEEHKHKLKWKLAYQAMHHVRLHNRWVCGELEAPEEESIVNPFIYAETEVWWAIGNEADGFAKELEAGDTSAQRLRQQAQSMEKGE